MNTVCHRQLLKDSTNTDINKYLFITYYMWDIVGGIRDAVINGSFNLAHEFGSHFFFFPFVCKWG